MSHGPSLSASLTRYNHALFLMLAIWTAGLTMFSLSLHEKLNFAADNLSHDGRKDRMAGSVPGSDALRLRDVRGNGYLELGRYEFGWTMMTPSRLEMHPAEEFSISCYGHDCLPRFQVRNIGDTEGAVWINGNNTIGSQFGPLRFAFGSFNEGDREIARFEKSGDLVLHHTLTVQGHDILKVSNDLASRISKLEAAGVQTGSINP